MSASCIRVLLVEDNPGDADLMLETLESTQLPVEVAVVVDGEEALDFLYRRGRHQSVQAPSLVMLDLNLPKKGGIEVLAEIKGQDALRPIPVVVWTSSDAPSDVVKSYALGASCVITKPVDLAAFQAAIGFIAEMYFTVVKLP